MTTTPPDMSEPAIVTRIREICLDYPQTSEDIKWENTVFLVREKIFALVSLQDDGQVGVWLKAAKGVQEALVGADPEHYFRPPYFGPKGWVGAWVSPECRPVWPVVEDLIDESFRLVAPKRVVRLLPDERTGNRK